MTSVPKPLKFLMPHYDVLKQVHAKITDPEDKVCDILAFAYLILVLLLRVVHMYYYWRLCVLYHDVQKLAAAIVSVLAMTLPDDKMRDCLQYRLLGSQDELGSWGHEYVRYGKYERLRRNLMSLSFAMRCLCMNIVCPIIIRHLTAEIAQAYNDRDEAETEEKPAKVTIYTFKEFAHAKWFNRILLKYYWMLFFFCFFPPNKGPGWKIIWVGRRNCPLLYEAQWYVILINC